MDLSWELGLAKFFGRWGLEGLAAGFVSGVAAGYGRRGRDGDARRLDDAAGACGVGLSAGAASQAAAMVRRDMTKMALRLIVIVGYAKVRTAHGGQLPHERLARMIEHIGTPTLSHWRAMTLWPVQVYLLREFLIDADLA